MDEEQKLLATDLGLNCLEHHGILGQRWGIRRYQNEDGTLTEAGKRRYARELSKEQRVARITNKVSRKTRINDIKANAKVAKNEAKTRVAESKKRLKQVDSKEEPIAKTTSITPKPKLTDEQRRERNRKIGMALGIIGGAAVIGFGYKYAANTLKKSGDTVVPDNILTGTSKSGKQWTLDKGKTLGSDSKKTGQSKETKSDDKKKSGDTKKGGDNHSSRDKNYAAAKDLEDWIKVAGTGLDFISKISNTYKTVSGNGGGK